MEVRDIITITSENTTTNTNSRSKRGKTETYSSIMQKLACTVKVAIKVDMSKAYDRVRWDFLRAVMIRMGFPDRFVNLIMQCVRTVS